MLRSSRSFCLTFFNLLSIAGETKTAIKYYILGCYINQSYGSLYSFARCNNRVSPVVMIMSKYADNFYKHSKWLALRERALKRDKFLCQMSLRYGKRCDAQMVHHIWPRDRYPQYQYCLWNLISLTKAEHEKLHDRTSQQLTDSGESLRRRTPPPSEKSEKS